MIVIQEAIYAIRNMHTGITYPDSSVNRIIDGLEKLKTLQAKSCEGCKFHDDDVWDDWCCDCIRRWTIDRYEPKE